MNWSGIVSTIRGNVVPRRRRSGELAKGKVLLRAARRGVLPRSEAQETCARPAAFESMIFGDALTFARKVLGFEPDAVQAQLLSSRRIRRLLLNCTRQWGKSTVIAVLALYRAWSEPESLILVVSGSQRQSDEFLRKVAGFLRRLGVKPRGDGSNRSSLLLPNGSRIVALPEVEETLRGFSALALLIIDEAAVVADKVYDALLPMLATTDGDLWLLSTPRGKCGFFWEEWENGGPDWTRIAVKAEDCPRISPAFLEEEQRRKGDVEFRREYCCEFLQPENAVFREEDFDACLTDDAPLIVP